MKIYENLKKYENSKFKRLVWVNKETFEVMLKHLMQEEKDLDFVGILFSGIYNFEIKARWF